MVLHFIIGILTKWAQEIIGFGFHNIYTFILIGLNAAFVTLVMERLFRFDRRFSWLGGLLTFVWLVEQVLVKRSVSPLILTLSVIAMLLSILFISGLAAAFRKIIGPSGKSRKMMRHARAK